jgi:predicted RNA binding protein YcfA (HicA-like mRNA interferase family)
MKRVDVIRKLEQQGCLLIRHGGSHDWYQNPTTGAPNPFHAVVRSKNFLQNTSLKR